MYDAARRSLKIRYTTGRQDGRIGLYSEVALANKTKERGKINKNYNGKFHSGGWVGGVCSGPNWNCSAWVSWTRDKSDFRFWVPNKFWVKKNSCNKLGLGCVKLSTAWASYPQVIIAKAANFTQLCLYNKLKQRNKLSRVGWLAGLS